MEFRQHPREPAEGERGDDWFVELVRADVVHVGQEPERTSDDHDGEEVEPGVGGGRVVAGGHLSRLGEGGQIPSMSRVGCSMLSLTLTRKVTASLPSTTRWS